MTSTEAKWAERVREWRSSGKTAEAFAEGRQFEASTLRYWASRLKVSAVTGQADASRPAPKPTVAMARVVRGRGTRRAADVRTGGGEIAISVGAARITVGRGFDPVLLRDVVVALGGAR
jgi:transposase